jgi:formate/nitrite transporter FocA (FNT family)
MRTGAGERVILGLGCTLFVATAVWSPPSR